MTKFFPEFFMVHHFGSVKRIKEASFEQWVNVVGKKTAELLRSHLSK